MSIFRIPEGDNLVTYYLLPLVDANKSSFGIHFKSSYVDKEGLKLYVELKSSMISPLYRSNPNYIAEMVFQNIKFIQFVFPSAFLIDVNRFTRGSYSKMSKEAKKIIYNTSTLPYNKTMGSFSMSHPVLQALDKTKTLRDFLTNIIGQEVPEDGELMESPDDSWFIEHRIDKLK